MTATDLELFRIGFLRKTIAEADAANNDQSIATKLMIAELQRLLWLTKD